MLKKMFQCKQVIPLMASLFAVVVTSSAEAITVNRDSNGNVTSVEDIQIIQKGVELPDSDFTFTVTNTYRVDFLFGSFTDTFGDPNLPGFDTSCELGESNKLCFWQNDPQATMIIDQINDAINLLDPIPPLVAGTIINPPPFPVPNTANFYLVPLDFDGVNLITSRQGRNNSNSWVTEEANFTSDFNAGTMYAGAELTDQEFKAEIPESSNLLGIVVTGLLMILVTKKK